MNLEVLVNKVISGEDVPQSDFLPLLCQEGRKERLRVNYRLASAYAQAGKFDQAKVFIERAWVLSDFSKELLPLYKMVCESLDDIGTLREVYKRLGICAAKKGLITQALSYFTLWQYAYSKQYHEDRYAYDFDIFDCIERMAQPYRRSSYFTTKSSGSDKIRLAYLVYGLPDLGSVIVKINQILAKYHDKNLFDVIFFVPEPQKLFRTKAWAIEHIKNFKASGCRVVFSKYKSNELPMFAQQIANHQPDILITSAALATFEQYFIAALKPAPVTVALLQGPPEQFVSPNFDWAVSWSKHPLIESPINTTLVRLGVPLPSRSNLEARDRAMLNIPNDAVLLMSAGRHVKFQNKKYWNSIIQILASYPNTHYVLVGIAREQVAFLDEIVIAGVAERLHFLGWRGDCVQLLTMADVLIDTYPSGGGHVLVDALALGVPFVSFENNYMKRYEQTDWSVADEFVSIPELMAPRGDFAAFQAILEKLIINKDYRLAMAESCKKEIHATMPDPENSVRQLEKVLLHLAKSEHKITKNPLRSNAVKQKNTSIIQRIIKKIL